MIRSVLVNGEATDRLSVYDRGLQFGDGLFETFPVVHGVACHWQRHYARLRAGCGRLGIPLPDDALLRNEIAALTNERDRAICKLLLTRGESRRGYRFSDSIASNRILSVSEWTEPPASWREQGVRIRLCDIRLSHNPLLAGIKHLNRLEQVLARAEWSDPEIAEGLMCDADDRVIEGTMSNLFIEQNGQLHTPKLDQCGVAGTLRSLVMETAEGEGIPVIERPITRDELARADGLYLTNALIGVWAVRELGQQQYRRTGREIHPLMAKVQATAYRGDAGW